MHLGSCSQIPTDTVDEQAPAAQFVGCAAASAIHADCRALFVPGYLSVIAPLGFGRRDLRVTVTMACHLCAGQRISGKAVRTSITRDVPVGRVPERGVPRYR